MKKLLPLVLLLGVVVLVSGCVRQQTTNQETNNITANLTELKIRLANSQYGGFAFDTLNSTYCEKIIPLDWLEQRIKDTCFSNVGIITKNVEICKNIVNITELYDCARGAKGDFSFCDENSYPGDCYRRMALITNNSALCDSAKEYTYSCYVTFASRTQSLSFCQKIRIDKQYATDEEVIKEDDEFFNWCIAVATRNADNCAKITVGGRADQCYEDVSKLTGNVNLCSEILVKISKEDCIMNIALANNDTSQCELIETNYTRGYCIRSFEYEKERQAMK